MSPPVTQPGRTPRLSERDDLAERLVLLIRESAAVEEARLDILLDASILAAEQVQDVRLNVLETPAEVTGWQLWSQAAVVFLLESNLVGKALNTLTRAIVGKAVRTNTLFLALPKSESGKELAFFAKYVYGGARGQVLRKGVPDLKLPGLS
ncbi:MAG: hypothetical protein K5821_16780, partial [Nitrobacter sp.]|uniref:hypothetical protein n=1 Tax=Nitrobacter sp. TaxID=29420 RepID=UPI00262A2E22